jgi:hypothetical protein
MTNHTFCPERRTIHWPADDAMYHAHCTLEAAHIDPHHDTALHLAWNADTAPWDTTDY